MPSRQSKKEPPQLCICDTSSLKECIDDRVTDREHEGYSRSFEEFVSGTPEDPLTKKIRVWHDHNSNLVIEEIQVLDSEGINHSLESSTSQSSSSGDKSASQAIDGSFASYAETQFENGMCVRSSSLAVVTLPYLLCCFLKNLGLN